MLAVWKFCENIILHPGSKDSKWCWFGIATRNTLQLFCKLCSYVPVAVTTPVIAYFCKKIKIYLFWIELQDLNIFHYLYPPRFLIKLMAHFLGALSANVFFFAADSWPAKNAETLSRNTFKFSFSSFCSTTSLKFSMENLSNISSLGEDYSVEKWWMLSFASVCW